MMMGISEKDEGGREGGGRGESHELGRLPIFPQDQLIVGESVGGYEFLVTVRPLYGAHLGPCDATISYHITSFIILYVEVGVWVNRVRRRLSY